MEKENIVTDIFGNINKNVNQKMRYNELRPMLNGKDIDYET